MRNPDIKFTLLSAAIISLLIACAYAQAETFAGYECTQDCSGHIAGYNWAETNSIDDPDDCSGNSQSFIEGCQTYALGLSPDVLDDDETENSDDEPPYFE